MGVTVVALACSVVVAIAAAAFFVVLRALRRSMAREASLRANLAQTNPQMMHNLEQMDVCTNKLLGILNSILDTSKVESGKMQLDEAEFSVANVLEESMDMINIVGLSKGLEVVWDPCDLSILCGNVVGDFRRLKQILDNVLGNSVKFTQQGHVVLRAWANRPIIARSSVCVTSRFGCSNFLCLFKGREHRKDCCSFSSIQNDLDSVELYFEVDDTGIGIPKEKRELVFEDYVQVKEGQGGTGLGLGIVQSFVRLMGGEISIKDKGPGKTGTCIGFNVFMKMGGIHEQHDIEEGSSSSQCCIRASALREANSSFEGGHCMLLVHGNETRRVLQSWLENLGMKVWLVPQLESLASALENVCHDSSTSLSRTSADSFECHADFCFRSRDTVSQILPVALKSSSRFKRSGAFGLHWSGALVVIDAHYGKMENICTEVNFPEIKKQMPCKIVCLVDANTSSGDLGRLRHHTCCDLVLQKPIHGSRLYALLNTLRDLQMAQAHHHPSHVSPENAETRMPGGSSGAGKSAVVALARSSSEPKRDGDKSLTGRRVLLVEDTLTLQTIGKKILYQLGADVEVAEDGAKAVSMFEAALAQVAGSRTGAAASTPYDAILMDCQMPVMDGYEATRRIREAESCYGVHTPIIALTAHAMQDEEQRQKIIAAGMDLHLTKPMERRSIAEAIRRVCVVGQD
ncbi:probable histidine kinase 2 [Miscanthus floridulus]|uniref:probable histidine kinase 2 n=1 Tax=Miscanthus floridulus TaxID=154761 RepID=UPI00345AD032